ncbi:MAG: tetratricopeptide repeat protein [Candidatus Brocadiaceae bacterium]|nr:tetratricopeptide repeat protein [Candidatus Brocadiaceae bacterium]
MKYTIVINPHIRPYLILALIIAFSCFFYYCLNFFLLSTIGYQNVLQSLNEPSPVEDENRASFPIHDSGLELSGRHPGIFFPLLKKSSNADHHFALAQYFSKLSEELVSFSENQPDDMKESEDNFTLRKAEALYDRESFHHYMRAVQLNPLFARFHIHLAEYMHALSKKKQQGERYHPHTQKAIIQHFEYALMLDNKWDHPFRTYGNWLFSQAEREEVCNDAALFEQILNHAALLYKQAIEKNNNLFLEGMDKYFLFTRAYHQLKKIVPETPKLYYSFAKYLQKNGLWSENEDAFYRDIQTFTDRFLLYKAIVEYLTENKRYTEAVFLLKDYLEYDPEHVQAHIWRGNLLFYSLRNKEEGIHEIESALQLEPENPDILLAHGKMLVNYEEYEQALIPLQSVLAKAPKRHEAYFLMGKSYEKLLELEKAKEAYENAVALNPGSIEYLRPLARLKIQLKLSGQ